MQLTISKEDFGDASLALSAHLRDVSVRLKYSYTENKGIERQW